MIGSRQLRLLLAIDAAEGRGAPFPSMNALASSVGGKAWETSANSESLRLLLRKGYISLNVDHPDAQKWGNGVPTLTARGREALAEAAESEAG